MTDIEISQNAYTQIGEALDKVEMIYALLDGLSISGPNVSRDVRVAIARLYVAKLDLKQYLVSQLVPSDLGSGSMG